MNTYCIKKPESKTTHTKLAILQTGYSVNQLSANCPVGKLFSVTDFQATGISHLKDIIDNILIMMERSKASRKMAPYSDQGNAAGATLEGK